MAQFRTRLRSDALLAPAKSAGNVRATQKIKDAAGDFLAHMRIAVIDDGCPGMFGPTADPGRKMMRCVLKMTGNVPREV